MSRVVNEQELSRKGEVERVRFTLCTFLGTSRATPVMSSYCRSAVQLYRMIDWSGRDSITADALFRFLKSVKVECTLRQCRTLLDFIGRCAEVWPHEDYCVAMEMACVCWLQ